MEEEKKEFKVPEIENNDSKKMVYLFLGTFVAVILLVSMFLKGISPKTELDVGEKTISMSQRDENEDIRTKIDERLKMIKNDEDMPGVSGRIEDELPEDVVKRNKLLNGEKEKEDTKANADEINLKVEPVKVNMNDIAKPSVNTVSKVYVGQYSDIQAAVNMQSNIMNSGVGVSPIIKAVNGYYTVQVGVFSNPESAKAITAQLQNAGFAAKIVKEVK